MASVTVEASSRRAFTFGLSDSSPKHRSTLTGGSVISHSSQFDDRSSYVTLTVLRASCACCLSTFAAQPIIRPSSSQDLRHLARRRKCEVGTCEQRRVSLGALQITDGGFSQRRNTGTRSHSTRRPRQPDRGAISTCKYKGRAGQPDLAGEEEAVGRDDVPACIEARGAHVRSESLDQLSCRMRRLLLLLPLLRQPPSTRHAPSSSCRAAAPAWRAGGGVVVARLLRREVLNECSHARCPLVELLRKTASASSMRRSVAWKGGCIVGSRCMAVACGPRLGASTRR